MVKYQKKPKLIFAVAMTITLLLAVGATFLGANAARPVPSGSAAANRSGYTKPRADAHKSSGILPASTKEIHISLDIDNGGVEIVPASSNEMTADYDSQFYDVEMIFQNNLWTVSVLGKEERMGSADYVQLQLPDIKSVMTVDVLDGDFKYSLPEACKNEIHVTAANGGIHFISKNRYDNSDISLTAQNNNYIVYEPPVYPNYFTKTDTGFEYKNGTQANKISVSLTGYTEVEFETVEPQTPASGLG